MLVEEAMFCVALTCTSLFAWQIMDAELKEHYQLPQGIIIDPSARHWLLQVSASKIVKQTQQTGEKNK